MSNTLTPRSVMVVDDHDTVLSGTLKILESHYPSVELLTARTVESARYQLHSKRPCLLLFDLSIPERMGEEAKIDSGIQFLREIMEQWPDLNITVQSSYIKALVRLVHNIDLHNGGFTVASKTLPSEEMLTRIEWALHGVTHTRDIEGMRTGSEMRPEWYTVLQLAFDEGLLDKVIAQRMNLAERTIRVYWSKIYDVLEIYPEINRLNGQNLRIQTAKKARELGLID